jgi:ATP-dependent Clp protease ATP-binding subunit ClpC
MFERFTDKARKIIVLAQEEARGLDHSYIGSEHILLALTGLGQGVGPKALEAQGISLAAVRRQVEAMVPRGQQAPSGHIPFTPEAKQVLQLSLSESQGLGHGYIGTEHILLGLLRESQGVAARALTQLGASLESTREQVEGLLHGYRPAAGP